MRLYLLAIPLLAACAGPPNSASIPPIDPSSPIAIARFSPGSARLGPDDIASLDIFGKAFERFYANGIGQALVCRGDGEPGLQERRYRTVRAALVRHGVDAISEQARTDCMMMGGFEEGHVTVVIGPQAR